MTAAKNRSAAQSRFCSRRRWLAWSPVALSLSTALLSTPVLGAPQSARIDDEIRFARGLAAEWQFVDLAQGVLDGLAAGSLSADQKEQVELARCDVFAAAARSQRDAGKREELYQTALSAYQGFLGSHRGSALASEAKRLYVDLGVEYGMVMQELLAGLGGEQAQKVRDALADRVKDLASFANDLLLEMPSAKQQSEAELVERYKLMYARGNLLLILGKSLPDGAYELETAESVLDDLVFAAGSETGFGLNAYHLLGRVAEARGQIQDAVDYYDYVLAAVIPEEADVWAEIKGAESKGQLDTRWLYFEKNAGPIIEARLRLGDAQAAAATGLRFYNLLNAEGFNLGRPDGYLATLAAARALLAAGGQVGGSVAAGDLAWYADEGALEEAKVQKRNRRTAVELALQLAGRVNQDNRGNLLQVRAQQLIAEAINLPGVIVTPEILFEAAQGAYNAQEYDQAMAGMRRVMAALETDADRKLYMPKVLWHLGSSLRRQDRLLEAAMAYRDGLSLWRGDEEWDPKNADGFYVAMNALRREAKGDASIEGLFRESEVLKASLGEGSADDILWRQADREYTAENFRGAREAFGKLPEDSKYREKALVRSAVCAYRLKQTEEARAVLEDYEQRFLADPRNQLRSGDTTKLRFRQEARAEARYILGQIARDAGDWNRVLELYASFDKDFGGQDSLISAVQYYRVEAQIRLGNRDQADALLEALASKYPDESLTGSAAKLVYNDYVGRAQGLDQATPEYKDLAGRMAKTLSLSNRLSAQPEFGALRSEANLWFDLSQTEKALALFERIVREHGDSGDQNVQKLMVSNVFPRQAECLMSLRRVPEAFAILNSLVDDPDQRGGRSVAPSTVALYARAVVGWIEGDPASPTLVPGVGGEQPLVWTTGWLNRLETKLDKWSCEWLENEWLKIRAWSEVGKLDAAKAATAKNLLGQVQREMGQDFARIAKECSAELQGKFRWLAGQIR
jgi:tetratricopeptide (TPR) repeat protein